MERSELIDILSTLCYDGTSYIIPFFKQKQQETHCTNEEFLINIEGLLEEIFSTMPANLNHNQIRHYALSEILFDGQGFYVPVFQTYINKKYEHQVPNNIATLNGLPVPYYDFRLDTVFAAFCLDVSNNKNTLASWVLSTQRFIGSRITDYIADMNTDQKGIKLIKNIT
jgi:hypothetical protein